MLSAGSSKSCPVLHFSVGVLFRYFGIDHWLANYIAYTVRDWAVWHFNMICNKNSFILKSSIRHKTMICAPIVTYKCIFNVNMKYSVLNITRFRWTCTKLYSTNLVFIDILSVIYGSFCIKTETLSLIYFFNNCDNEILWFYSSVLLITNYGRKSNNKRCIVIFYNFFVVEKCNYNTTDPWVTSEHLDFFSIKKHKE
jgi:hypothetical protein